MKAGYLFLPEVYDRWQQSYGKDFTAHILPKLLRTIKSFKVPTSTVLDLACGTGTLAIAMAQRGSEVFAIDASEGMLFEGRRKIKGSNLPVIFLNQDMRSFELPRQVDLITCMFDAMNHLASSRDLLRCFRGVHKALQPNGYFIFDVNNELGYRTVWRQTEVIHEADFTIILQNSFDAPRKRAESVVTLFIRRGHAFEKKTETVRERCYPRHEIEGLLGRAGFQVLKCEDFNFTPDPMVGEIKTWWVARKTN